MLPREREGIKALEAGLDRTKMDGWMAAARMQKVSVFLPRFRLETKFVLNNTLAAMGMSDPFGPQADFSGMDGARDLFISTVVHKAFVEVNEEGTEAAAVTTVTMRAASLMEPLKPFEMIVNRPFFFVIGDSATQSILFMGVVYDPARQGGGD